MPSSQEKMDSERQAAGKAAPLDGGQSLPPLKRRAEGVCYFDLSAPKPKADS